METHYEQLLERSNLNLSRIKELEKLPQEQLARQETPKKWSIIQVIDHLNKVYDLYEPNFKKELDLAPALNENKQKVQHTLLGRLSIYSMKPKGQKRRFKMKTFDFFEPTAAAKAIDVIEEYTKKKDTFNGFIKAARMKNLNDRKMPTALGEKMKFYVAECFDFILAHEERHMVQIEKLLVYREAEVD